MRKQAVPGGGQGEGGVEEVGPVDEDDRKVCDRTDQEGIGKSITNNCSVIDSVIITYYITCVYHCIATKLYMVYFLQAKSVNYLFTGDSYTCVSCSKHKQKLKQDLTIPGV